MYDPIKKRMKLFSFESNLTFVFLNFLIIKIFENIRAEKNSRL